ncbi:hypothetical protein B0H19DRAFT_1168742 [Mycena capillaripes]|nr:hypothetical protein B0H19DRAFT_1168742 [Mycena capillaripes]
MTKRKRPKTVGGAPSPHEWAKMKPYGAFSVTDAEGQPFIFSLGDTAAVLPGGTKVGTQLPAHKYWVVKILAIRGRRESSKRKKARSNTAVQTPAIWVKVNWFYSPEEASESFKIEGFDPSHCSEFERIYSDHNELISALTFDALVPVIKYREDDPDQDPISSEVFFCRYFLHTSSTQGAEIQSYASSTSLPTDEFMGCICGSPYNLKDTDPLHVMNMCPRSHCRRFYHSSCLLQYGHWGIMIHPNIRLSCTPDADNCLVSSPSKPEHPSYKATGCSSWDVQLPPNLLLLAAQPIVRGAALPALGITGNSRDVVYARRILNAALQGTAVPDSWEDEVDFAASVVTSPLPVLQLEETGEALVFACPNCSGPI